MATPSIPQESSELIAAIETMLAETEVETEQDNDSCPLSEDIQVELWQLIWKLTKRFGHVTEVLQLSALLNLSDATFEQAHLLTHGQAA